MRRTFKALSLRFCLHHGRLVSHTDPADEFEPGHIITARQIRSDKLILLVYQSALQAAEPVFHGANVNLKPSTNKMITSENIQQ